LTCARRQREGGGGDCEDEGLEARVDGGVGAKEVRVNKREVVVNADVAGYTPARSRTGGGGFERRGVDAFGDGDVGLGVAGHPLELVSAVRSTST
jgi:hypothetical protein